ncbi:flavodoxin family protein [Pedobacter yulinensis]|uniref:Flavodoxin family protein n=1 Tax=Pedobacter yulinensis TaxID=2126353 RepID=A0A2T3HL39_9SPHI|nr:NAD(P)H-dependent oxidoreductase [Pedobacter yulinensis]PST83150.1 flavodoxin family protein [Pedobacter yulinensis]
MKVLIVYAHPEPQSFNGAMYRQAIESLQHAGHEVRVADLTGQQFDPVSGRHNFRTLNEPDFFKQQLEELHASRTGGFAAEIAAEQEKLEWCDIMIWQFPLWWFSVPAILKGWVDRVFAMGRIYGAGRLYANGTFKGKRALLSVTMGGAAADYIDGGLNGELAGILRPLHRGILEFTGFTVLEPQVVYGPARLDEQARRTELQRWHERLLQLENEQGIEVGRYR